MRKVLVISSTPRKQGNSDILADQVVEGARLPGAKVEKILLRGMRINPCNACDACQKSRETPCVQKDDMTRLYPKILQADALVLDQAQIVCAG